jgi:hypothetical protein
MLHLIISHCQANINVFQNSTLHATIGIPCFHSTHVVTWTAVRHFRLSGVYYKLLQLFWYVNIGTVLLYYSILTECLKQEHTHTHTHTYIHTYVQMYIHTHTHTYTHTHVCEHMHIHTHTSMHTHIHTYTYTHTHLNTLFYLLILTETTLCHSWLVWLLENGHKWCSVTLVSVEWEVLSTTAPPLPVANCHYCPYKHYIFNFILGLLTPCKWRQQTADSRQQTAPQHQSLLTNQQSMKWNSIDTAESKYLDIFHPAVL